MIRKLEWDSGFFGIRVGEWHPGPDNGNTHFNVVYVKSSNGSTPELEGFTKTFEETKVVFAKAITQAGPPVQNIRSANANDRQELYLLAYESGRHSRFRLDPGFGEQKFKELYRAWTDNSLDGKFADEVAVFEQQGKIAGFVTCKHGEGFATIGLIGVLRDFQGKGIGKLLLQYVERLLAQKQIPELRIPTQLENTQACEFYKKQGYTIAETTQIMHYWNNDTI